MAIKIVIGTKSGKTYQKELSAQEAESLYGKMLGEEFNGEMIGFSGIKFFITGGSDSNGFPMRKDLIGDRKKKILITKSVGFRGKLRGNKFSGLRVKKTVAGNTVFEKTNQINVKIISGEDKIEAFFAPKESE